MVWLLHNDRTARLNFVSFPFGDLRWIAQYNSLSATVLVKGYEPRSRLWNRFREISRSLRQLKHVKTKNEMLVSALYRNSEKDLTSCPQ